MSLRSLRIERRTYSAEDRLEIVVGYMKIQSKESRKFEEIGRKKSLKINQRKTVENRSRLLVDALGGQSG